MSETPGEPEYYTPPVDSVPPAVQEPPSISDAAAQFESGQQVAYTSGTQGAKKGLAITALVLGIIAFVTGLIPVWGFVVGFTAIAFGVVALAKKQSKGMAITGIVTGALAALTSIAILAFVVLGGQNTADQGSSVAGSDAHQTTLGPSPADGGLAVTEQAFGPEAYDPAVTWFVVLLNNPNDKAYSFSTVTVNALDSSGAVVDTSLSYPALAPGATAVSGSFYELSGAKVASLEVVGPSVEALSDDSFVVLTAGDLAAASTDSFTTVAGTVTSPDADLAFGGIVNVVARDAGGTIIGSAQGSIDAISQGHSATFDAMFYSVLPEGTTYEAYVSAY